MAELLLLNPRGRRKARRATGSHKRRRSHAAKRRRNPVTAAHFSPVRRRRHNPIAHHRRHHRRRRNPIGGRTTVTRTLMQMLTDAFIGGTGGVIMDIVQGQVNTMLPAALRTGNVVGAGDAVKAALTVAIGHFGRHTPLVRKAAQGALTVQVRDILSLMMPAGMMANLGWASPYRTIPGVARVGPTSSRMGAYQAPGTASPLLAGGTGMHAGMGAFMGPGARGPLLSNSTRIMNREGIRYR